MKCKSCGQALNKEETVCSFCGAPAGFDGGENEDFSGSSGGFSNQTNQFDFDSDGDFDNRIEPVRRGGSGNRSGMILLITAILLCVGITVLGILLPGRRNNLPSIKGFAAPSGQWEWIDQGRRLLTNELLVIQEENRNQRDLETVLEKLEGAITGYFPDLNQYQVKFNISGKTELDRVKAALEQTDGISRVDYHMVIMIQEDSLLAEDGAYPAGTGESLGILGAICSEEDKNAEQFYLPSHSFRTWADMRVYLEGHPGLPEQSNRDKMGSLGENRKLIMAPCYYLESNSDGSAGRFTTTGAIRYQIAELFHAGARVIALPVSVKASAGTRFDEYLQAETEQTEMLYRRLEEESKNFLIVKNTALYPAESIQGNENQPPETLPEDFLTRMLCAGNHEHIMVTTAVKPDQCHPAVLADQSRGKAIVLDGWSDPAIDFCVEGENNFYATVLTAVHAARILQIAQDTGKQEILNQMDENAAGIAWCKGGQGAWAAILDSLAESRGVNPGKNDYRAAQISAIDQWTENPIQPVKGNITTGNETYHAAWDDFGWILTRERTFQVSLEADAYEAVSQNCSFTDEEWNRGSGQFSIRMAKGREAATGMVSGKIKGIPDSQEVQLTCKKTDTGEKILFLVSTPYRVRLYSGTYQLTFSSRDMASITVHSVSVSENGETDVPDVELGRASDLQAAISGIITDAYTGQGLGGAELKFYKGLNAPNSGTPAGTVTSGSNGNYQIKLPGGTYTVYAGRTGYIEISRQIIIEGEKKKEHENFSLSPVLPEGQVRIVLEWGKEPEDIDSHLINKTQNIHIYYSQKTGGGLDSPNLDVDDRHSFGPETTTIPKQLPGVYTFYVHDYTNAGNTRSSALGNSGARVTVYLGNQQPVVFEVPNEPGTLWEVFSLENGIISPSGRMSYESAASNVGRR